MTEQDRIRIEHILESIADIEQFMSSMSREEFIMSLTYQN
jgi:uncharacterized protein with HEPN domain